MIYQVIAPFADAQDKNYVYGAGDSFPRAGYTVSAERLEALASSNNARGYPLLKAAETPVEPRNSEHKEVIAQPAKRAKKAVSAPNRGRRT